MPVTRNMYCPSCDEYTKAERQSPNHALHIVLTLLTCAAWLWVYLLAILMQSYRCANCGSRAYAFKGQQYIVYGVYAAAAGTFALLGFAVIGAMNAAATVQVVNPPARQAAPFPANVNEPAVEAVQPAAVPEAPNVVEPEERPAPAPAMVEKPEPAPAPTQPAPTAVPEKVVDPKPEAVPEPDNAKLEKEAAGKLKLAKTLRIRNESAGNDRLREIVEKYPGTEAAEEAAKILAK